jgi:hypothetical protein
MDLWEDLRPFVPNLDQQKQKNQNRLSNCKTKAPFVGVINNSVKLVILFDKNYTLEQNSTKFLSWEAELLLSII